MGLFFSRDTPYNAKQELFDACSRGDAKAAREHFNNYMTGVNSDNPDHDMHYQLMMRSCSLILRNRKLSFSEFFDYGEVSEVTVEPSRPPEVIERPDQSYDARQELFDACQRGDTKTARKHMKNYLSLPPYDHGEDEMLVLSSCAITLGRRNIALLEVFDSLPPYAQDYWNGAHSK